MRPVFLFSFFCFIFSAVHGQRDSSVTYRYSGKKIEYRIVTYSENDHPVKRRHYWLGKQLEREEFFRGDTVYSGWETHFFPFGNDTVRWENGHQTLSITYRMNGDTARCWINGKMEGNWHTISNSFWESIESYKDDTLRKAYGLMKRDLDISNSSVEIHLRKNDTINLFNYHFRKANLRWMIDETRLPPFLLVEEERDIETFYDLDNRQTNDSNVCIREIAIDSSGKLRRSGKMTYIQEYDDTLFYPSGKIQLVRRKDGNHFSFYDNGNKKEVWKKDSVYCFSKSGELKKIITRDYLSSQRLSHPVKKGQIKNPRHADKKIIDRYWFYFEMPFGYFSNGTICLNPVSNDVYDYPKGY